MKDEDVVRKVNEITTEYNKRLQALDASGTSVAYALRLLAYRREILRIDSDGHLSEIEKHEKKLGVEEGILREARKVLPKEVTTDFATLKSYIEEESKLAFTLMEEYRRKIKEFYMRNKLELNAVRVTSPEEFEDGVIPTSKGLLTQFEEEKGDFVFASSTDPSRNAYLARAFGKGMYGMKDDTYFYPGDNLTVENGRLFISKTAHIYYMNPDEFTPVVSISRDRDGKAILRFGEEWTIPRDVDIEKDVTRVENFRDVTRILDHIQAISSTDKDIVSRMYSRELNGDEKLDMLLHAISEGKAQYWNGVLSRNPIYRGRVEEIRQAYINRSVEEMKKEAGEEYYG